MRKLILNWLLGIDNVKPYMELLSDSIEYGRKYVEIIQDHINTLEREKENLDIIRKLIRVCENHGIDVDEEIKHIQLYQK